jgi:hypothetical protein
MISGKLYSILLALTLGLLSISAWFLYRDPHDDHGYMVLSLLSGIVAPVGFVITVIYAVRHWHNLTKQSVFRSLLIVVGLLGSICALRFVLAT